MLAKTQRLGEGRTKVGGRQDGVRGGRGGGSTMDDQVQGRVWSPDLALRLDPNPCPQAGWPQSGLLGFGPAICWCRVKQPHRAPWSLPCGKGKMQLGLGCESSE